MLPVRLREHRYHDVPPIRLPANSGMIEDVLADLKFRHVVDIAASNIQTASVFVDLDYK
jgi:hypothetical protein